jgi:hypothetical protein
MRVALIVVTMLAVTTPSEASQSCMSKAEARQHFGAVHIYWHGPDHCWDATPSRHRQIQVRQKPPIREVQRQSEPKWHDALSAMLPDDDAMRFLTTPTPLGIEHQGDDAAIGTSWADRWVDIGPSQSPLVARRVRVVELSAPPVSEFTSALMISTHDMLVLAFIAFVLTLGTVGVLYRHDL